MTYPLIFFRNFMAFIMIFTTHVSLSFRAVLVHCSGLVSHEWHTNGNGIDIKWNDKWNETEPVWYSAHPIFV